MLLYKCGESKEVVTILKLKLMFITIVFLQIHQNVNYITFLTNVSKE